VSVLCNIYIKCVELRILSPNVGLEIGGEMNLAAGIQVAQLALKHRQNKKQQQRIIVFAGRCLQLCLIMSFHFIFPVLTLSSLGSCAFQSYQT
jgi:hypothetical protein